MLRCSTELLRYEVKAADGDVGTVRDFYFDDRSWKVRFILIDTDGMFGDNLIMVEPHDIGELRFPEETIVLKMTRSTIEESGGQAMFATASAKGDTSAGAAELPSNGLVLRSARQIASFEVTCEDGKIGYVHGLLIETTNWSVRYLIVDTGHWLPGKLVLLSPLAVDRIDWEDQVVTTDVTEVGVKNCPPYDIDSEISREYEAFLHDHYGWPKYWS
ncbi:MAG: PRC-barrel domain-containing protein [Alphaproteobacteria bacterium]|nr:PRC-barrel domain-containing protein [Alphaproteobacteria bacterium]